MKALLFGLGGSLGGGLIWVLVSNPDDARVVVLVITHFLAFTLGAVLIGAYSLASTRSHDKAMGDVIGNYVAGPRAVNHKYDYRQDYQLPAPPQFPVGFGQANQNSLLPANGGSPQMVSYPVVDNFPYNGDDDREI